MNLVLGASGTLGSRVVRRLLDQGETVRAVSRDTSRLADAVRRGAVPIQGDLRTAGWMTAALDGVRSLVLATHGLVPPTRDNHPDVTDDAGNRRIIDAAKRAGVQHILFVSVMSGARSPSLFADVKYRVEEYLKASGIAYTIVRPAVFIETHALRLLAEPLRDKGSVQFLGPGRVPLNWISADDIADYIVGALRATTLHNRTASIGGPDNLSRLEVLAIIERVLGRTARRTHLPLPVIRGMRLLLGPLHPGMRYLLDMALAEGSAPDDSSWMPRALDWTGPTTVQQAVQHWASPAPAPG